MLKLAVLVLAMGAIASAAPASATTQPGGVAANWGREILDNIVTAFYMPAGGFYAEEINSRKKPAPSWIWDASIQLGALNSAARVNPNAWLAKARAYAVALGSYRTTYRDVPGFDVNPPPKKPDRYFDDNAWICRSLLETYELTHAPGDLALANDAFNFTMSGEDNALGGGIYWHEDVTRSKNTCSSGPAMLAAIELYRATGDEKYLASAKRLYDWTRSRLQDKDGLLFDSIGVPNANLNRAKLTYNSATVFQASGELYLITHERPYLDEAERIAKAAEGRFVRPSDGIITGAGKLGVKLVEAYLALAEIDHNDHWKQVVGRCLSSLHNHRNAQGWYPQNWQSEAPPADGAVRLIDQSAVARAFWIAAQRGVQVK